MKRTGPTADGTRDAEQPPGRRQQEVPLDKHAEDGWALKAITSADVKGRIGPGAVEGLLLTLERPRG
ncbi:DUF4177 domain-containing protein [Streptomyces sp. NPDC005302]|uniref:DUF4177 domain-containing protein n=1 Tax=Streptomyces sp. NPDC005302 TaxID=3154675 RepID=UPI0033B32943